MVLTTRLSGGKGGRNGLEHELRRLGITQKNGKPNHPRPRGKPNDSSPPEPASAAARPSPRSPPPHHL
jgi:hypothetical protein